LEWFSRRSEYEDMSDEPEPVPNKWDLAYNKPELGDFTLQEYMEKVIMYGLVMVTIYLSLVFYSSFKPLSHSGNFFSKSPLKVNFCKKLENFSKG